MRTVKLALAAALVATILSVPASAGYMMTGSPSGDPNAQPTPTPAASTANASATDATTTPAESSNSGALSTEVVLAVIQSLLSLT